MSSHADLVFVAPTFFLSSISQCATFDEQLQVHTRHNLMQAVAAGLLERCISVLGIPEQRGGSSSLQHPRPFELMQL